MNVCGRSSLIAARHERRLRLDCRGEPQEAVLQLHGVADVAELAAGDLRDAAQVRDGAGLFDEHAEHEDTQSRVRLLQLIDAIERRPCAVFSIAQQDVDRLQRARVDAFALTVASAGGSSGRSAGFALSALSLGAHSGIGASLATPHRWSSAAQTSAATNGREGDASMQQKPGPATSENSMPITGEGGRQAGPRSGSR